MSDFSYDCPSDDCAGTMEGDFGDDVTCPVCGKTYHTSWDYVDEDDGMAAWITGEAKGCEVSKPPKPDIVTAEHLIAGMIATGKRLDRHPCAMCDYMTGWFMADGTLFFDSGCCCSAAGPSPPSRRDVSEFREWLSMNSHNDLAERLWQQLTTTAITKAKGGET